MKRIFLALSFIFLFFLFTEPLFASEEFKTEYNIRYQVNKSGIVSVNHQISLTNKLSRVYATQYSLTLPSTQIQNIKATDSDGDCQMEINKDSKSTTIIIKFNQQVVGVDKTLTFNLTYENLNAALRKGEIWEINIPRISNLSEIDSYSLSLNVPQSFGNPAFIRPEPIEVIESESFKTYRFTQNRLFESGINATFGPFQIFNFTLFYYLDNSHYSMAETEIALPPDTAFQQLSFKNLDPRPLNIRVDQDGNWLAKYKLKPRQQLKVIASGRVKILAQPQKDFPQPNKEILDDNLSASLYWEVNHPQIIKLSKNLKTPKVIYNFVINTLEYNFDRVAEGVERLGAVKALENPSQAICMEFTDLFITLARASGIPAREINGFAYTDDIRLRPLNLVTDVLHSWPEYYDEKKQLWVPIDPTWEKTTEGIDYFYKSDLNHFVFAIHGQNSEEPYPAGSYKSPDSMEKTVQVAFGEYEPEKPPKLQVDFSLPAQIFWKETKKGKLIIKNEGQTAFYNLKVKINAQGVVLSSPHQQEIPVLPPFSYREISLIITPENAFAKGDGLIKISVNDQDFEKEIEIGSFIWQIIIPSLGGALTLATLFILLKKKF